MIDKIREIVRKKCGENNWSWKYHIPVVVKYANMLAEKLDADKEIVEIAAWLHDITRLQGDPENHHITGPIEAEKILRKLNYPQDRINMVKHCINAHRGSQSIKRETIEAECIASADAMSHFDDIPALFYLNYVIKKLDVDEGRQWIKDKLERSWKKLIPVAKEIMLPKYEAAKIILGDTK